jgi:hypothetical protein
MLSIVQKFEKKQTKRGRPKKDDSNIKKIEDEHYKHRNKDIIDKKNRFIIILN